MASSESTPTGRVARTRTTAELIDADPEAAFGGATTSGRASDTAPTAADPARRVGTRQRTSTETDPPVDSGREREPFFEPSRRPGRRVIRIVRHIQLWSVFKVALLGGLVFYVVFLIAIAVAWSLANATGQVHHVEQFMREIGFDNWSFNGAQLFRGAALVGAILLAAGTIIVTLWAGVINLIAELTGGLRFTVIETDEVDEI